MASTIPPKLPLWAYGVPNPNILEPGEGKKLQGWVPGEQPPAAYFNYWMNLVGEWIAALRDTGLVQSAADMEAYALAVAAQTPTNPNKGASNFKWAVTSFDPVTGWAVWWTYEHDATTLTFVGRENVLLGSAASTVGGGTGLPANTPPYVAGFDGVEHVVGAGFKLYKVAWAADVPSLGAEIVGGDAAEWEGMAASPTTRIFIYSGGASSTTTVSGPVGGADLPDGSTITTTAGGSPHVVLWDPALEHFVYVSANHGTTFLSPDGLTWHQATNHDLTVASGAFSAAYFAPMRAVVVCGCNADGNYVLRYSTDGATTWLDAGLPPGRNASAGAYQEAFASQAAVYVRGYPRAGASTNDRIMYCGALGDPAAWKFFELPAGTTGTESEIRSGIFRVLTGTGNPANPRRTTVLMWPKTFEGLAQMSRKVTVP